MRILFINSADWLNELRDELGKTHEIVKKDPDVIIGMSVIHMADIWQAHYMWPKAKLINYNWDVYSWVWTRPRKGEYDYDLYGKLLKESDEVWTPSYEEQARTKKWFNLDAIVIKTFVPVFDAETRDGGYLLSVLRELPDDNDGWFEELCKKNDLPYIANKHHNYKYEEYKEILANCTAIVSYYKEASTGGLDVIKGYYLGKPVLVSETSGANSYLGYRAMTFNNTKEDLEDKLLKIYDYGPVQKDHKEFVIKNYGVATMAIQINRRLANL